MKPSSSTCGATSCAPSATSVEVNSLWRSISSSTAKTSRFATAPSNSTRRPSSPTTDRSTSSSPRSTPIPVAQVHTMHERLEGQARELGMTWSFATAKPTNTFDAHRVIALASTQGLGDETSERLFRAYFSEGELVSDHQRLSELAGDVGVRDVDALWEGDAFSRCRASRRGGSRRTRHHRRPVLLDRLEVHGDRAPRASSTSSTWCVEPGRDAPPSLRLRSGPPPPSPPSGPRRGSSLARPSRHGPGTRPRERASG